ncbi:MAG: hypothetical protein K2V38_04410, partial [Gemmataceae bacterium]|nr:hypothetical protein [Gemmataceae bacterium]
MPRPVWLVLVCACAAGVVTGAIPRGPVAPAVRTAVDLGAGDDPFPIRRVRAGDDPPATLLKELEPGPTARLPRTEFESRVRLAARASARAKPTARIADATYTADFDGSDLTGTAELGIVGAGEAGGFLSLAPLRLAIAEPRWAGGEAVTATLSVAPAPTAPAVWVSGAARQVLAFRWSLAGTTELGARRFELLVPQCPTSVFDLRLPVDQVPSAGSEVLLTGPFDVPGRPDRRSWKLRFGGRAKLEFTVRGTTRSAGATAALVAEYDLEPGFLSAAFEYDLRPARGAVGEWAFTADPGLRVTEVLANNRAGWAVDPPAPTGARRVRVWLRQPSPGGKIRIQAVAPLTDPARP